MRTGGAGDRLRWAATGGDPDRPRGKVGLLSCIAFAVGTMVGAGVFVLSGLAIRRAGPAALAAFGLAGVLVLLSALSFAVVASVAPPGGSGYAYVGTALGRHWGFVASWCFYLGGVIGTAFVLNAFGVYVHRFFWGGPPAATFAICAVGLLALLNLGPASAIGRAEVVLVAVKVGVLVLLVAFALIHVHRAHFTPFLPHGAGSVVTTSALLFIAYLGFNVLTNMAGDVDRPHRTIPLAIVVSMAIVAAIYLGVVVALLAGRVTTYDEASVGTAARHLMGAWGGVLIPVAALVSPVGGQREHPAHRRSWCGWPASATCPPCWGAPGTGTRC
ncbi:MAG: APC family permease [Thermoleophilia bacterium]